MTWAAVTLCIICQILIICGQLCLKRGIAGKQPRARFFLAGLCCLTVWFFLWLGLMGQWDLSKLYPFEGLNPAMMAIAACIWLKEKLPPVTWVGVGLVCIGVAVVCAS